jgi:hypothetical protein
MCESGVVRHGRGREARFKGTGMGARAIAPERLQICVYQASSVLGAMANGKSLPLRWEQEASNGVCCGPASGVCRRRHNAQ